VVSFKRNDLICSFLFSKESNLVEEGGVYSNLARSTPGDFSFNESVGVWLK